VAHREHDMIGLEEARRRADAPPAHGRLPSGSHPVEIVHPVLPAIFAAQRLDGAAHALDHRHQPEGADMRMRFGEDLLRRAGLDELLQHLAAQVRGSLIRL
jgi:hypothetical protein